MPACKSIGMFVIFGLMLATSTGCGHSSARHSADPTSSRCHEKLVAANAKIAELKSRISELEQGRATLVARAAPPQSVASDPVTPRFTPTETPESKERGFWLTIENTRTGESKTRYYSDR